MRPATYKIITFGCQMNASDSEILAGVLEARGMRPVEDEAEADVVLLNTCVVRASAERRALGRVQALKALKTRRPECVLAVCGCMAQRDAEAILDAAPHVDVVLGARSVPFFPALLDRVLAGAGPAVCVEEAPLDAADDGAPSPVRRHALKALVTVMQGCDNWCSYCIVPAVRGPERSRSTEAVLEEVRALVADGCREVMLLGQNVNAYRDGAVDFAGLLERVDGVEGLQRIRYMTSHPRDADRRHVEAVARLAKVCDHFHLPVQAGSNAVLERMGRGYTRRRYLELVEEVRTLVPGATITTDLIVGFPGETEKDFEETLDLVARVRFNAAFTFIYNVREGTRAAALEDDVPLEEKKRRIAQVIATQEAITLEKNRALVGEERTILVEDRARRTWAESGRGAWMGRTTGDQCVVFPGEASDLGRLVRVRVVDAGSHTLFGEKIEDEKPARAGEETERTTP